MSLLRRSLWTVVVLFAAASLLADPSCIQAQQKPPAPRSGRTLLSINPLGLPFQYVSSEVEQRLSGLATLGGSVSYLRVDNGSYVSLEAKLRLYPNEEAFKGFSVGVAAGLSTVSASDAGPRGDENKTQTAPTFAVIADYNWFLGKTKRVLVGTGLGAKRIFASDRNDFGGINFAYPTARFQIGVLF